MSRGNRDQYERRYHVTETRTHPKGFTEYKVTAEFIAKKNPEDVNEVVVWKRYSDFKKLHGELSYTHRNLFQRTQEFPPFPRAQVFGRFEAPVIEERRQASENMLNFTVNIPALNNSPQLKDFFRGGYVTVRSDITEDAHTLPPPLVPQTVRSSSFDFNKDVTDVLEDTESVKATEQPLYSVGEGEPAAPVGDGEPAAPVGDGEPAAPVGDGEPAAPVGDGEPAAPVGDGEPAAPVGDGEPAAPVGDGEPAAPVGDGEPAAPVGDGEPAAPVGDGEPAAPVGDGEPAAPVGDCEPAAPVGDELSPFDLLFDLSEEQTLVEEEDGVKNTSTKATQHPLTSNDLALFDPCFSEDKERTSTESETDLHLLSLESEGTLLDPADTSGLEERGAYVSQATLEIQRAMEKELAGDYPEAFRLYRNAVDTLLSGVKDDPCTARRDAVARRTAEYLRHVENIFQQHMNGSMD